MQIEPGVHKLLANYRRGRWMAINNNSFISQRNIILLYYYLLSVEYSVVILFVSIINVDWCNYAHNKSAFIHFTYLRPFVNSVNTGKQLIVWQMTAPVIDYGLWLTVGMLPTLTRVLHVLHMTPFKGCRLRVVHMTEIRTCIPFRLAAGVEVMCIVLSAVLISDAYRPVGLWHKAPICLASCACN